MPWPEVNVRGWQELVGLLSKLTRRNSDGSNSFVYRGQPNANWSLLPSIMRELKTPKLKITQALEIEKQAFTKFMSQAHLHVPEGLLAQPPPPIAPAFEFWSLMQHHGAPTRLLDWCYSPYVAVYFAVITNLEVPGAVWAVNSQEVEREMRRRYLTHPAPWESFVHPDPNRQLGFFTRVRLSDRMVAQQGLFSVATYLLSDHAQIIEETLSQTGSDMTSSDIHYLKIVIPPELKDNFLWHLSTMNVTANSLFPGIDGLGKNVAEFIRLWRVSVENPSLKTAEVVQHEKTV